MGHLSSGAACAIQGPELGQKSSLELKQKMKELEEVSRAVEDRVGVALRRRWKVWLLKFMSS